MLRCFKCEFLWPEWCFLYVDAGGGEIGTTSEPLAKLLSEMEPQTDEDTFEDRLLR